jgi:hypothetical protein
LSVEMWSNDDNSRFFILFIFYSHSTPPGLLWIRMHSFFYRHTTPFGVDKCVSGHFFYRHIAPNGAVRTRMIAFSTDMQLLTELVSPDIHRFYKHAAPNGAWETLITYITHCPARLWHGWTSDSGPWTSDLSFLK